MPGRVGKVCSIELLNPEGGDGPLPATPPDLIQGFATDTNRLAVEFDSVHAPAGPRRDVLQVSDFETSDPRSLAVVGFGHSEMLPRTPEPRKPVGDRHDLPPEPQPLFDFKFKTVLDNNKTMWDKISAEATVPLPRDWS